MPEVLIELGEEHGTVPDRSWTSRRPWWRLPGRLDRRRVAALLATLVLLLAAGGAARWPGQRLRLVGRFAVDQGASVMVDTGRLIVLGDGDALVAYATRDARRLWRAPLDVPTAYGSMTVSDGVVLVSSEGNGTVATATEAVDESTGRVLWSTPATMFQPLPGDGTVLLAPPGAESLRLVDLRTGAPRWTHSTTGCQIAFDVASVPPTPRALALLCDHGTDLDVVDLRTGTATGIALAPTSPPATDIAPQLVTAGPAVVVERADGPATTLIEAYPWRGGPRLWSRPGFGREDFLTECAGHLCVYDSARSAVLDPLSGAALPLPVPRDPRASLATTAFSSFTLDRDPRTLLLVPAGRPTPVSTTGYVVYAQPAGDSQVLQPFSAGSALPADSPRYAHPSFVLPHGTVLVQVVGPDGGVEPLQPLDGITPSICVATATYLVCPTGTGVASVWEFPAG